MPVRPMRPSRDSRCALVLRGILLVRRILRGVVPHVRPCDEHHGGNAVLHVSDVIARSVMLVDFDVKSILASVGRFDRLRCAISSTAVSNPFARNVGDILHHALRNVVDIGREGIGSPLEDPKAAALRQANPFHVEIQIADDDFLLVRVRSEPCVGAADLLHPLEVDSPFGTR